MKPKPGRYGIEGWFSMSWLHPGYWKTLFGLRADRSSVVVDGTSLRFIDYPFAPATVFPTGAVTADQIAEVNLGHPPQVRLNNGDILFVAHTSKDAFNAHSVAQPGGEVRGQIGRTVRFGKLFSSVANNVCLKLHRAHVRRRATRGWIAEEVHASSQEWYPLVN